MASNDYKQIERAGTDYLGEIWKARRNPGDPPVRVHVITFGPLNERSVQALFVAEVGRAMRISHPRLAVIRETGVREGRAFVVSDWAEGGTLAEYLRRKGPMEERAALRVALDLAGALRHAWNSARMPHGQLTPDSVLLDADGRALIVDFGQNGIFPLRAARSEDLGLLLQLHPCYAPPELVRNAAELDFRADIYALGTVLYHLLTGVAPFGDKPPAEALDKHLFGMIADPKEVRPSLSTAAAWLLDKLLIRDVRARYAGWDAVYADLEAVSNGFDPAPPRPAPGQSIVRRSVQREPQAAAAPGVFGPPPTPEPKAKAKIVVSGDFKQIAEAAKEKDSVSTLHVALGVIVVVAIGGYGILWAQRNHLLPQIVLSASSGFLSHAPPPEPEGVVPLAPRPPPQVASVPAPVRPVRPPSAPAAPVPKPTAAPAAAPAAAAPTPPPESPEPVVPQLAIAQPALPADAVRAHPGFKKGAGLFNDALRIFKKFEADGDPSGLGKVVPLCDEAAAAFKDCLQAHPDAKELSKYIEQCYGLVRYTRQRELMSGNDREPSRHGDRSLPMLAAPPSSVADAHRIIRPAGPAATGDVLKLGPAWNSPPRVGEALLREFRELTAGRGRPAIDLKADPELELAPGLPYLATMDEAAGALGVDPPSGAGTDVTSPFFPDNSFRFYEFKGKFGEQDRFSRLRMIVDVFGHAVALQMVDERALANLWLPEPVFSAQWTVFEPVTGKVKDRESLRIAHRVRVTGKKMTIDTELADLGADAGSARSLLRSTIVLPQPVLNLMLLRTAAGM